MRIAVWVEFHDDGILCRCLVNKENVFHCAVRIDITGKQIAVAIRRISPHTTYCVYSECNLGYARAPSIAQLLSQINCLLTIAESEVHDVVFEIEVSLKMRLFKTAKLIVAETFLPSPFVDLQNGWRRIVYYCKVVAILVFFEWVPGPHPFTLSNFHNVRLLQSFQIINRISGGSLGKSSKTDHR